MAKVYEYIAAQKNAKIAYDSSKYVNKETIIKLLKHMNAEFIIAEKDNTISKTLVTLRKSAIKIDAEQNIDPDHEHLLAWKIEEGHWAKFDLTMIKNCNFIKV